MSEDTHVGVEVDGSRVTVVETLGGMAIASRTIDLGTLAESLPAALEGVSIKRSGPPARVCVVAQGTTLRRIEVSAQHLESRDEFEEAVFMELPMAREASSTAGLFFDRSALVGEAVSSAAAVTAPLATVDAVYTALGDLHAEVVPSPFALGGHDGVWLGLHMTAVEATLVENGYPVMFRQLRTGGLSVLASVLGDGVDFARGHQRLMDAITRTGVQDPIADAEVARYLRSVAIELNQTLDFWRRSGEVIDDAVDVVTYGRGAASPAVRSAFSAESLTAVFPDALSGQMVYVPPADRDSALLAFLAAVTASVQAPQSVFANPKAEAVAARRRARRRRLLTLVTAGTVLTVVLLAVAVPVLSALRASADASSRLEAAEARALPLQPVYHQTRDLAARAEVVDAALAREPQWSQVIKAAYLTVPASATITGLTASLDGGRVTVTVEAQKVNGTYEELSGWLDRLAREMGAVNAWSSGFSVTAGTAVYQVSFEIPASAILSQRAGGTPVPAAPMPTAPPSSSAAPASPAATPAATPAVTPAVTPAATPAATLPSVPATVPPAPGSSATAVSPQPTPSTPAPSTSGGTP